MGAVSVKENTLEVQAIDDVDFQDEVAAFQNDKKRYEQIQLCLERVQNKHNNIEKYFLQTISDGKNSAQKLEKLIGSLNENQGNRWLLKQTDLIKQEIEMVCHPEQVKWNGNIQNDSFDLS